MNNDDAEQHPLEEGDLLAYLEGAAPPDIAHRIAHTPELMAEVARLQMMDVLAHEAQQQVDVPDIDVLLLYQAGLLDEEERQQVEQQVRRYPACQHELDRLALPPHTPAAPTPTQLSGLLEKATQAGKRWLEALLLPAPMQPAFAVRGAEQRRLVYEAEAYQIILAVEPQPVSEAAWNIEGQISVPPEEADAEGDAWIRVFQVNELLHEDRIDEFGFFFVEQIASGHYTLYLELPSVHIILNDIVIA